MQCLQEAKPHRRKVKVMTQEKDLFLDDDECSNTDNSQLDKLLGYF